MNGLAYLALLFAAIFCSLRAAEQDRRGLEFRPERENNLDPSTVGCVAMMLSAYLLEDTLPEVLIQGNTARSVSARRARRR